MVGGNNDHSALGYVRSRLQCVQYATDLLVHIAGYQSIEVHQVEPLLRKALSVIRHRSEQNIVAEDELTLDCRFALLERLEWCLKVRRQTGEILWKHILPGHVLAVLWEKLDIVGVDQTHGEH